MRRLLFAVIAASIALGAAGLMTWLAGLIIASILEAFF